jgi:K+ transporter
VALGVVFGDIGTSPLYTLKTVLGVSGGAHPEEDKVSGTVLEGKDSRKICT